MEESVELVGQFDDASVGERQSGSEALYFRQRKSILRGKHRKRPERRKHRITISADYNSAVLVEP